jgi:Flp pilus assembly protein TadG
MIGRRRVADRAAADRVSAGRVGAGRVGAEQATDGAAGGDTDRAAHRTAADARAARLRRRRRERGSIGAFVAVLAPPIIGLIGLVYDGGLALEGRQRALDMAEQAARAAGNHCDLGVLREESRCVIRDAAGARAIAEQYMGNGVTLENFYTTDCNPDCVTVAVRTRVHVDTVFLGLFGVSQFDIVMAERRATAVTGLAP